MTNFICWNCRGFKNKRDDIKDIIADHRPICFAFQETYLKQNDKVTIRGYTCFRKDVHHTTRATGGVALLVSNDFPHTSIPLNTNIQAVAVQIHIRQLTTVCTIYIPPNYNIQQHDLNNLIMQLPTPFVILGDFNAHNPLWGSTDINPRGQLIEDFITGNCLCILNNGENTYFHEPSKTFHAIDLVICSPILYPYFNFSVSNDLHSSDHFPLFLSFHDFNHTNHQNPRYIYDRADWATFTINSAITQSMIQGDINRAVALVTQIIIRAADISIPKSSGRPRKHSKPWWNEECQLAKKRQQKAWGIFRRYPTSTNYIAYKQARASARKIRRKSQKESWINYISNITSDTSSKQLWHRVKKAMGIYPNNSISFLKENGQTITSTKNIANTIGRTLSNISKSDSYSEPFLTYKRNAERSVINFRSDSALNYNSPFTENELNNSLKRSHLSAPGPDGITYPMIKHLSLNSRKNLLHLYNRIYTEQVFPAAWHDAIVIPFPKPGKDPTNPQNYRPIALTCCLCKILEKMVNARLVFILEQRKLIPPWQSGFRRGRSTIDNILMLETNIRNANLRRNHFVSVLFDIEKAYDKTWRYGILKDLLNFDFRGNLPIFIKNFLMLRRFQVRMGSVLSDFYFQEEGVPQGSVLSVTLFSLKINGILKELPHTVYGNLYVDDLNISCQGKDMRYIERQLQLAINRIIAWTNKNGFRFSIEKTHCVHFCRIRGVHPDPEIYINRQQISVSETACFLGVTFDKKITFIPHILNLRTKCDKSLNILKVLSNTSWGADCASLLKIYRAIIRSKLDYACQIYGSAGKSYLKKLDTVHHAALRICSGAFRTSPVVSMYVECVEPPLYLIREQLSLELYYRILSHPHHPLHIHLITKEHDMLYANRPSCIPNFGIRIRHTLVGSSLLNTRVRPRLLLNLTPWNFKGISCIHPFKGFDKANTPANVYRSLFASHRSQYHNYIEVYTDGSKTGNIVGCGIICRNTVLSYRLPASFSVFSAEFFGIETALKLISSYSHKHFIIYTDSQSVLETLQSNACSPTFISVLELYNELCKKGFHILFCWVPGHVGISGNEAADKAAKQACNLLNCPIPYSDIKLAIKYCTRSKWQSDWDAQSQNKFKEIKPHISIWPTIRPRKTNVILTRLRIGHSRLTHRHLLLDEEEPTCPHCHFSVLTIRHLLTDCSGLRHMYRHFFNSSSPTLTNLLGENPHTELINFLKEANFYHDI